MQTSFVTCTKVTYAFLVWFSKQNEHRIALELALTRLEHKLHKLRFGELDMVVLYKENKVNNIYKNIIYKSILIRISSEYFSKDSSK